MELRPKGGVLQTAALRGLEAHPQPGPRVSYPEAVSAPTAASPSPLGPVSPTPPGSVGGDSRPCPGMRHTQAHTCHTALWAVGHPHSWCWYSESGLGGEGVLSLHPLLEFCLAQVLNDWLGRAPQPCSAPASPRPLSQAALSAPGLSHTPTHTVPSGWSGPTPAELQSLYDDDCYIIMYHSHIIMCHSHCYIIMCHSLLRIKHIICIKTLEQVLLHSRCSISVTGCKYPTTPNEFISPASSSPHTAYTAC